MKIYDKLISKDEKLAVVGLGYVGLPIALEFAKKLDVIGFDINVERVNLMKQNIDPSNELIASDFENCAITFTSNLKDLQDVKFFIIAVPTPIDKNKKPDINPLLSASKTVGKILKKGDYVVYESTVYPGCTEEDCIPVLEELSGLTFKEDFKVGYSPERINPGDKVHTLSSIIKVSAGCDKESAEEIAKTYELVVEAGVHRASSIKVAEAAKIIENTQRDVNIALINELSVIFNRMDINTYEVLEAAGTKWNFLNFKPGLVGGHCIGVDPYYLNFKANMINLNLDTINSSRNVNESMPKYIFNNIKKISKIKKINIKNANSLIIGAAFKENCPDIRNSGSIKLANYLKNIGSKVSIYDPLVNKQSNEYINEQKFINNIKNNHYDIIIYSVDHKIFQKIKFSKIKKYLKKNSIFFDLKFKFKENEVDSFI